MICRRVSPSLCASSRVQGCYSEFFESLAGAIVSIGWLEARRPAWRIICRLFVGKRERNLVGLVQYARCR